MPTNFHTNVGSADIAAFLQFQMVSDLFQTSFGMSTNFHTNVGSADIAAFLRFQTCFRPLWDAHKFPYKCRISGHSCDLFGMSTNFHTIVGSADIAAFLQFQTCFRPLWDADKFPYKCRISGYSCFPTVSDLFQTSLGRPQISIQM